MCACSSVCLYACVHSMVVQLHTCISVCMAACVVGYVPVYIISLREVLMFDLQLSLLKISPLPLFIEDHSITPGLLGYHCIFNRFDQ